VDATPVTERDVLEVRKACAGIWNIIKKRDIEGLKNITSVSTNEMAYAEGTTTGIMFHSTGFPEQVTDKSLSLVPIEWGKYKLISYRGGRLFRLGVGFF